MKPRSRTEAFTPYCCARVIPYFTLNLVEEERGQSARKFRLYRHRTTLRGRHLVAAGSASVLSTWNTWAETREVMEVIMGTRASRASSPVFRAFKKEDVPNLRPIFELPTKPAQANVVGWR